ncbi:hypothetical protein VKT23_010002 [Stygiomarasmius scandens]|uniref:GST N-terminal domain-containing protein n=1 Tax=Marasmiellus scandens TaxID=2682957 RepID=A0ABR1JIM4_9AGAR
MITLYDLKSLRTGSRRGLSLHTWKVRFALRFKGIAYTLHCIELEEVEATAKALGAPPTSKKPDGSPHYTVPFIHDSKTNKYISNSFDIVEYLDATYPETVTMIPPETRVLQGYLAEASYAATWPFITSLRFGLLATSDLTPATLKWVLTNRPTEQLELSEKDKREAWDKVKNCFGEVAKFMKDEELFVLGGKVSFADAALFGQFASFKFFWDEDTTEWKEMMQWHGGRWSRLIEAYNNLPDVEVQPALE